MLAASYVLLIAFLALPLCAAWQGLKLSHYNYLHPYKSSADGSRSILCSSFVSRQRKSIVALYGNPVDLCGHPFSRKSRISLQSTELHDGETNSITLPLPSEKQLIRLAAWSGLTIVAYAFKPFVSIIIFSFYFSVIGNNIVKILQDIYAKFLSIVSTYVPKPLHTRLKSIPRQAFAALYIVLLLASLTRFCFYLFPQIIKQSQYFIHIAKSEDPYTLVVPFLSELFGSDGLARLESFLFNIAGEKGQRFAGYIVEAGQAKKGVTATKRIGKLLQYFITGYLNKFLVIAKRIISNSTNALYSLCTGILFSLMITWDLPNIKRGVQKLKESKIAPAYSELAPKLSAFRNILAQGFEVQALISLVNCVLTTAGLMLLKIPGVEFFSLLTFVSSFIPIAGIFIATIPPLIVALTEFGAYKCYQVLMMVVGVHAVESYVLFPQIYSAKLKLHPLLVLASLTVAEHFAGILGLFLAMPVTVFVTSQLLFPRPNAVSVPATTSTTPSNIDKHHD